MSTSWGPRSARACTTWARRCAARAMKSFCELEAPAVRANGKNCCGYRQLPRSFDRPCIRRETLRGAGLEAAVRRLQAGEELVEDHDQARRDHLRLQRSRLGLLSRPPDDTPPLPSPACSPV